MLAPRKLRLESSRVIEEIGERAGTRVVPIPISNESNTVGQDKHGMDIAVLRLVRGDHICARRQVPPNK